MPEIKLYFKKLFDAIFLSSPKAKATLAFAGHFAYLKDQYFAGKAHELQPPLEEDEIYLMMLKSFIERHPERRSSPPNPDELFKYSFNASAIPDKRASAE